MKNIIVNVTAEDIENYDTDNLCTSCPVGLALKRQGWHILNVGYTTMEGELDGAGITAKASKRLERFLKNTENNPSKLKPGRFFFRVSKVNYEPR